MMVRRSLEEGWSVAAVASAFEISTHRPQVARPFPQRRRCRPGEPRLGAPPRRQKADDALGGHDHPPGDEYRMVGAERARAALQPHPRGRPRSLRYQEARRFRRVGPPITGDRRCQAKPQVGSSCTWRSMTRRARFVDVLPDEKRHSPASWSGRCAGSRDSAFGSSAS
jgi:hypothetical protein